MSPHLNRLDALPEPRGQPIDDDVMTRAVEIVEDVRRRGEVALREHGERHGDLSPAQEVVLDRTRLERAVEGLSTQQVDLLDRVAGRIRAFAAEQRKTLIDLDVAVTGGRAGHRWIPVASVGAYAPGGRHPLPSSALMTIVPARVAGVERVWAASPRPSEVTLAAAGLAGSDGMLAVGGAQAIAALAFGTVSPACDMIVGPGNKWVTAAKKHLYGEVGIDGLAGPSEIMVIADHSADPELVAADLLAQAEHDTVALPVLVTTSASIFDDVDRAISRQLTDLPTSETATTALGNGFALVVSTMAEAVSIADDMAPEHLALHVEDPRDLAGKLHSYGSVFIGDGSAEVFADYGVGPNHVLPTGGGARFQSGLSVLTFLRSPTWSRLDDPGALVDDTVHLARIEGLEAHARAAQLRSAD
jgi:phosphoribosyl-ATP pyrophosphohydrolase/phosphoribosyl-AMP cyclohydrolase/histidinol dehydrogenase